MTHTRLWLNENTTQKVTTFVNEGNPHMLSVSGSVTGCRGQQEIEIHGTRAQMWKLHTALTDALMESEDLTEADLTAMDKAFLKIAAKYQDCEAVNEY